MPPAKARVALQNAQGGIDGRKIQLIVEDDQTNPTTNQLDSNVLDPTTVRPDPAQLRHAPVRLIDGGRPRRPPGPVVATRRRR